MSRSAPTNRVRTLKGCPFCGGRGVYFRRPIDLMGYAGCQYGCAQSPDFMTKKAAAEWWNQRAPADSLALLSHQAGLLKKETEAQRRIIEGLRLLLHSNHAAFTAMRNDLNELFPIQSPEADLLTGPEFSVSCAAIVTAARAAHDVIVERCAQVIDRLNHEGPYQAIIGGREIRKLKSKQPDLTHPPET